MSEKVEKKQSPSTRPVANVLKELRGKEEQTRGTILVLGHGTIRPPEDIFIQGLGMKQEDLMTTTIPIAEGEAGIKQIRSWEHHIHMPWVVLIAAETPSSDSNLPERERNLWEEGLIQPASDELIARGLKYVIPSEWIVGAVDTNTGETVLNPQFTGRQVTAEDMATSEGLRYVAAKFGNAALRDRKASGEAPIPQPDMDPRGEPLVW